MLLLVSEMMCNHCTSSVEKALRGVATVTDVSVDLDSKLARVTGAATASEYLAAVSEAGHPEAELVPHVQAIPVSGVQTPRPFSTPRHVVAPPLRSDLLLWCHFSRHVHPGIEEPHGAALHVRGLGRGRGQRLERSHAQWLHRTTQVCMYCNCSFTLLAVSNLAVPEYLRCTRASRLD